MNRMQHRWVKLGNEEEPTPKIAALTEESTGLQTFPRMVRRAFSGGLKPAPSILSCSSSHSKVDIHSLQDFFEKLVSSRGYSTQRYSAMATAHFNPPTTYQTASYDDKLVDVILRSKDAQKLEELLDIGWSPNACNERGLSFLHRVCRKGLVEFFHLLVQYDACLFQSDSNGRTVLHEACKQSSSNRASRCESYFIIIDAIVLKHPHMLFVDDIRGMCPLQYAACSCTDQSDLDQWKEFLRSLCDRLWPQRSGTALPLQVPRLCLLEAGTRSVPKPKNALSTVVVSMVVSGCISPREAKLLHRDTSGEKMLDDRQDSEMYDFFDESIIQNIGTVRCLESMASVSSIKDLASYMDERPSEVKLVALNNNKDDKRQANDSSATARAMAA